MAHAALKIATTLALAIACATGSALAQTTQTERELGAHEHGRGKFNMAIEKGRVSIELEAAGVDIVGFEHAPNTPAERDAVEAAKRRLLDPIALFGIPSAAGCKVAESSVELEGAHHHEHGDDQKGDHKHEDQHQHAGHTEFQAQYVLDCTAPQALTALEFAYFDAFAAAASLEIVVISEKSQIKTEATRKVPKVALLGLQ